ncbi:MAG: rhamnogalacturonan acetylesterase [Opitutaceae bacterium]|jgi:lysophospholipase L1-like esterase
MARLKTPRAIAVLASLLAGAGGPARAAMFSFGPGPVPPGYTQVLPETRYSAALGYGFEGEAGVREVERGGKDTLRSHFCTADRPFHFSVAVPEGNYTVTVLLGDLNGESTTTVKAELRRLEVEEQHTASGQFSARRFVVNVRTPRIGADRSVRLKPREKTGEFWDWDDKLTLEFSGERPCVCAVLVFPAPGVPTLYLAGDSTVCDQPYEPFASWGQMLPRFFGPNAAIANHAESGESLRSFIGEGRLAKLDTLMRPGDFLFIQFGHNDQKETGENVGAFTTYKADLERFVADARAHGTTPVLVTPVSRRTFGGDGRIKNSLGDYPEAVRRVAAEQHVALIDLNDMSRILYEALGPEKAKAFFPTINGKVEATHHNNYGSYELAKCVVEGIRSCKLPIADCLIGDTPPFDPEHPDPLSSFAVPPSPKASSEVPYGN